MAIKRIVANLATNDIQMVRTFYEDIFDLKLLMEFDWIVTLGDKTETPLQISIATQGGSGTEVPDLSIEVDDLEKTLSKVQELGHRIIYGPVDEPWGVRRFYIKDPTGRLLNILQHQ